MAFTSSATAVSANSNCSCSDTKEGKQPETVNERGEKEAGEIKSAAVLRSPPREDVRTITGTSDGNAPAETSRIDDAVQSGVDLLTFPLLCRSRKL